LTELGPLAVGFAGAPVTRRGCVARCDSGVPGSSAADP